MCGAVRFTVRDVPTGFGACNCDMCRRWSGGRWMGVHVARKNLTITGEDAIKTYRSSPWAERAFCGTCGSNLWYRLTEGPDADSVSISVGMLNETDDMKLTHEYYTDRNTGAYDFPEDRIQMTEAEVIAMFAPTEEGEPT
jgi:hypothetical protein